MILFRNGRKVNNISALAVLFILSMAILWLPSKPVKAAEAAISVKSINYCDSTITLQLNSGDTKVYFSDSKKKVWEEVPAEISSTNTVTMDISWVSPSKNYVMTFKADKSTGVISVTIPKQATNFKASYNKIKGTVVFSNVGVRTIEWRKKDSPLWNTVNQANLPTELSYLFNNGASLYFRLAPVNGTGITNIGFRPSKEVSVTIPKKTSAPNIKVNGSKFLISVKKGMAYRIIKSDGSISDWTNISASTDLLLKNVAASTMYSGAATQAPVSLQFRTNATNTSQVSKITTVIIPVQEGAPSAASNGILINYTSSSTVSLQVKAASSTMPFEYTITGTGETLNYLTAVWTSITSSTAVSLSSKKAPGGSHIYVRKKSIDASEDNDFSLASVETDVTGTTGLSYPDQTKASTLTTLIAPAGVCQPDDSSTYLSFALNSPTSTTVSSISFLDAYGINKGSVTLKSTVARNYSSTDPNTKYLITTRITSTSNIDSITKEMLYAQITLANGEVITSTADSGVKMYLYPKSTVNNPSEDDYTNNFNRVYLSKDAGDDSSFKFKLDFGTAKVINPSAVDSYTSDNVAINSIKYDGYTLLKDTDYIVEYGSYVNSDEETIATATVMVNVAGFENNQSIDTTDQALPLVIYLNNGEVLDNDVNMTLISTATMDNIPIAWSITEGSLKETTTKTITNTDNTTTTVTEELITYTITLTLFDKNYGVGISDVTWGDSSVFGSATIKDGKATISLSNAKINKLDTATTDTKNIVVTLSNGFVIKSGCKLTILNAD